MRTVHLSYVICTTVRSGSWMLCSALAQTGVAGRPGEYFGQTLWEEIIRNRIDGELYLKSTTGFMDRLIDVSTTANGIFGTKLPANHAGVFFRRASEHAGKTYASLRTALEETFPNLQYVLLTRENKVAQAVSLYRAAMSGQWRTLSGDRPAERQLEYDHFGLQRCYQHILASDAYWDAFFSTHGLRPLTLTYEELTSDYAMQMRRILAGLGLPWHHEIKPPHTARQADERSLNWAERFIREGLPKPEPPLPAATFWAPY